MNHIINTTNGLLDLSTVKVMGIVNLTPDSYYAESRKMDIIKVVDQVGIMIEEGAEIIDLGAMSTRPGAIEPSISEELDRLIGPLMAVRAAYPEVIISVDTYRTEVLKACLDLRINMVNDISGGRFDARFLETVALSKLPYVLMHALGRPSNMQDNVQYEDLVLDIMKFFDLRIAHCRSLGIKDIIVDPGFGFGKSLSDNYKLLSHLTSFGIFDCPVLVGLSRKSMIYKLLDTTPQKSLSATSALHMLALQNGAKILRVHDVLEAQECITLWSQYEKTKTSL